LEAVELGLSDAPARPASVRAGVDRTQLAACDPAADGAVANSAEPRSGLTEGEELRLPGLVVQIETSESKWNV
jgi:hypothetical protein